MLQREAAATELRKFLDRSTTSTGRKEDLRPERRRVLVDGAGT
jgi:hypothetical protein